MMYWRLLLLFAIMNTGMPSFQNDALTINRLLRILKRRLGSYDGIYDFPRDVEDLPKAARILPGHTLIRPSLTMLKSAVKFPQKEDNNLVYGNKNNIGIPYGNTNERVMYTGFRKSNELLKALMTSLNYLNTRNYRNNKIYTIIVIPARQNYHRSDPFEVFPRTSNDFRRSRKSKFRDRNHLYKKYVESSSGSSSGESEDYEKNPGNPYTIHKNKYKQNWMWNHVMSGDHMNVNPFAPKFSGFGPSGAALIFGRKWWYFNQDDYKPL